MFYTLATVFCFWCKSTRKTFTSKCKSEEKEAEVLLRRNLFRERILLSAGLQPESWHSASDHKMSRTLWQRWILTLFSLLRKGFMFKATQTSSSQSDRSAFDWCFDQSVFLWEQSHSEVQPSESFNTSPSKLKQACVWRRRHLINKEWCSREENFDGFAFD